MKKPISVYVKAAGATLLVLSSACLCGYRLMKIQIVDSNTYISQHRHLHPNHCCNPWGNCRLQRRPHCTEQCRL